MKRSVLAPRGRERETEIKIERKRERGSERRAVSQSARRGFAPVSGEKWLSLIFRAHSKGRSDRSASPLFRNHPATLLSSPPPPPLPPPSASTTHNQWQLPPPVEPHPVATTLARPLCPRRHAHSDLIQFPINSQSIDSNSVYRAVAARSGPACL